MKLLGAVAALALMAGGASAATLSTLEYEDGFLSPFNGAGGEGTDPEFGADSFGTYGQTVTFNTAVTVSSFGFRLADGSNFSPVGFDAYIKRWDEDTNSTGDTVFSLADQTTAPAGGGDGIFELKTIGTGDLLLEAGTYALLFDSISGGPAAWATASCNNDTADECEDSDAYDGGKFIFSATNDGPWLGLGTDSSFVVDYTRVNVVPVAASLPLLGGGLLLFGALGLRRKRG